MKLAIGIAVFGLVCRVAFGGLDLAIENDVFFDSDNNYTHGTEIEWFQTTANQVGSPYRVGYGVHQLIYSPSHIEIPYNQPEERPWCGLTTAYRETRFMSGVDLVQNRMEVGVLGPWSQADKIQTWFHRITGNKKPMGWDNQMPNEPAANDYYERHHPLLRYGQAGGWQAKLEAIYGGTLGTTFINGLGGVEFRAGYNVPPFAIDSGLEPKGMRKHLFAYLLVETEGMIVMHNATLGKSFFRDRDPGHEQELEHCVGMYRYGGTVGYDPVSFTFLIGQRSNEFKDEDDGGMDFGLMRLEIGF